MPSYLSALKLQNYYSQRSSCAFLKKNQRKVVLGHQGNKRGSATNSIRKLSQTLSCQKPQYPDC